ncbi:S-adenosyl-L-methionine-dependent methyltransferase [Coccomyxa subellipsoidea C-169]|uniref:S-adenosyl-L-methionine-dependent methyltransferase n=1 Tax=Coccomyxa subellipsoidea (strain C-169) TaxID=574566 RepID=I0YKS4_COCSC|nr:S-adenosyl-L-methionine-dependent methyltransferase [Coccomyxa subellipsoidea C-169]EIE18993.1 S-adenosyl-L-methionine-dependent methyltransferase [Coccomyxa subellipsoidea C-169]|eukprot:XP_005643537.1 S-adenosyl-L-methionine-dependent methyltransferase [Coccomyxa subellipsoidea C-169]
MVADGTAYAQNMHVLSRMHRFGSSLNVTKDLRLRQTPLILRRLRVVPCRATAQPISARPLGTDSERVKDSVEYNFACPICLTTEFSIQKSNQGLAQALHCDRCARTFSANEKSVDLTSTSGAPARVYKQSFWGGTQIFRSPLVSFAYERGWRSSFTWAGFPGEQKEFEMAMDYLQAAYGEVLVDMSCGSGLFSRRFVRSGKFAGVIAADFSESMLTQAKQFFDEDRSLDTRQYVLLRADVGRLPFPTGSVAAIHAGAAIHCWPNPTMAVAEISRVLRPGGVFVGSTFLKASAPLGQLLNNDDLVRPLNSLDPMSGGSNYQWWEEAELRELTAAMGLQDFQRHRTNRFIMFAVQKPRI